MITVNKEDLAFLSIMDEMKVDANEVINISYVTGRLRFFTHNQTKGVVISELEITHDEEFSINVRSSKLVPLIKSIQGEVSFEVTSSYLSVVANRGKSISKIELVQYNVPDPDNYLGLLNEKPDQVIPVKSIEDYTSISPFVSRDLADGFSCVVLEKDQMIGFPSGQLIAYQTLGYIVESQLKINRLVFDIAQKFKLESIEIKEYSRFSYLKIRNNHVFFSKRTYPDFPPLTEDEFYANFNHPHFFEVNIADLFPVLSRIQFLSEDVRQTFLIFNIVDENTLRITDNFSSIEEELVIHSEKELIGKSFSLRTELLLPVGNSLKKEKVKVYTPLNEEATTVKIVADNKFFVLTLE